MITVEDRGDELYVVDVEKNEVTIRVEDWERGGTPHEIDRRVHETIVGKVSKLRFPEAAVCIESEEDDQWTVLGDEVGPYKTQSGNHLVQVEANITIYARFTDSATIRRINRGEDVIVDFGESTDVTLGFKSRVRLPRGRITIEPTPRGVAAGITYLSAAIETTTPDRSYPSLRGYPPLLEFGEELVVPEQIQESFIDTGITLEIPNELPYLLIASPLVYYLQASVTVRPRMEPRLVVPSLGFEYSLDSIPRFQITVADTLRQVFFLDCLAREGGPYSADLEESHLLSNINFDVFNLYTADPGRRLVEYLTSDFQEIESSLPEWHLSTFVRPELNYITSVPHLLNRLSLIFLPDGSLMNRTDILEESLKESHRVDVEERGKNDVSQPIKPISRPGRIHGWLAEGAPTDAFKIIPAAFENRFKYIGENNGQKSITVVLNDLTMSEEQTVVEKIYKERSKELSINVEIKKELTREELAEVFEKPRDFVHYIGHCDNGGFRCCDDYLSIEALDESNVRTFFLNACDSYHEGLKLLEKGSVAGAVTLQRVLDQQATQVGAAFARLIINGFSVAQALRLARCQAVMSKVYVSIGDGTYTLSQYKVKYPMYLSIEKDSEGIFSTSKMCTQSGFGAIYQSYLNEGNHYLIGMQDTSNISKDELLDYLSKTNGPVMYDGDLLWSSMLYEELRNHDSFLSSKS